LSGKKSQGEVNHYGSPALLFAHTLLPRHTSTDVDEVDSSETLLPELYLPGATNAVHDEDKFLHNSSAREAREIDQRMVAETSKLFDPFLKIV